MSKELSDMMKIINAAKALVDKLDLIEADPKFQSVWVMTANHGVPYTGPTYSYEKQILRNALAGGLK